MRAAQLHAASLQFQSSPSSPFEFAFIQRSLLYNQINEAVVYQSPEGDLRLIDDDDIQNGVKNMGISSKSRYKVRMTWVSIFVLTRCALIS